MKSYLMYKVETKLRSYYFFDDDFGSQKKDLFYTLALLKSQKIGFDLYVFDCVDENDQTVSKKLLYKENFISD